MHFFNKSLKREKRKRQTDIWGQPKDLKKLERFIISLCMDVIWILFQKQSENDIKNGDMEA